jgi:ribosomal protein L40E
MIKLCLNCDTENPADAVLCSECGMSLRRAPTAEEALKLKEDIERKTESPMRKVADSLDRPARWKRWIAPILVFLACCWTLTMGVALLVVLGFTQLDYPTPVPPEFWLGSGVILSVPWVALGIMALIRRGTRREPARPRGTE